MKKIIFLILIFVNSSVLADSFDESLKELFELTGMQNNYTTIHGFVLQRIQAGYYQSASQSIDANDLNNDQKKHVADIVDDEFENIIDKYESLVKNELPYEKAETEIYIPLFKEVYSEQEIQELIKFYKTPVGKKSLETTSSILDKASEQASEKLKPSIKEFVESEIPTSIEVVKKEMKEKGIE